MGIASIKEYRNTKPIKAAIKKLIKHVITSFLLISIFWNDKYKKPNEFG
tara:strand:- start:7956 stop:8102 length:147 start_codon:yes stop_codon:yes gene_type:complete